jgi:hypothetical protein
MNELVKFHRDSVVPVFEDINHFIRTFERLHASLDGGNHRSAFSTYKKMKTNYYMHGLRPVVDSLVSHCVICQVNKQHSPPVPIKPILTSEPLELVFNHVMFSIRQ